MLKGAFSTTLFGFAFAFTFIQSFLQCSIICYSLLRLTEANKFSTVFPQLVAGLLFFFLSLRVGYKSR